MSQTYIYSTPNIKIINANPPPVKQQRKLSQQLKKQKYMNCFTQDPAIRFPLNLSFDFSHISDNDLLLKTPTDEDSIYTTAMMEDLLYHVNDMESNSYDEESESGEDSSCELRELSNNRLISNYRNND